MKHDRKLVAWLLVLVCAAAQITVSVPRLHGHGGVLPALGDGHATDARPAQKNERGDAAAHECLACRVLTLASTLTRTVAIDAPRQQVLPTVRCAFAQWSPVLTDSVRGRAPPAA